MSLSTSQYNSIIRRYDELQADSRHLLESRKQRVYDMIPEFRDVELEIVNTSMEYAPLTISSDPEEFALKLQKMKVAVRALEEKKTQLLLSHGLPADYLEPEWVCPDCHDTGFAGDKRCHCFKQAVVDLVYSQSNLKQVLARENFDTFSFDCYSDKDIDPKTGKSSLQIMHDAYDIAQSFVQKFDQQYRNLFFYGEPGLGKTFLSNCIANELLKTGHTVLYLTSHQLFDALGKKMRRYGDEEIAAFEEEDYILNCDLLIIDDLGSEMSTAFTISNFNNVLNSRLLTRRPTILSSNLSFTDIREVYGDRNFSRIGGGFTLVRFYGDDIRLKKRFA